ncbi:MAG: TetR/AcrR family transcriptional regulator [Bacteroidetes bacterium]|nr:TetR/AcrR family transcriptional regulator [Bacteroidota bacterium]
MDFNDKQLKIIETAEELFAEMGFSGTSVRDIADKAGVNVAMISYYFGSKEKLLEALFSFRVSASTQILESILKDTQKTPLEKVNMVIDYYVDRFNSNQCFHKIMVREQVASHRIGTSDIIHHYKKRNQDLVKQLVHEGQKTGDFNKHVDVPLLMTTLIGTVSHLVTTQHYYRVINNLEDMPEEQFQKHIKKKLSNHLKFVFKATLTHEA